MNRIRTADGVTRYRLALIPIDTAFFESEQRWGVGRLERLVSAPSLASYQRGWEAYRAALDNGDAEAIEAVGPKMIAALKFLDQEATAAGHQPLAPDTWEAPLGDGRVLVVCRTQAEASAVVRASHASGGLSAETTIPPDLAVTIRHQHEGRSLVVITMAEVARLLVMAEGNIAGISDRSWDGTPAHSGVQQPEFMAHDIVRRGFPLEQPIAVDPPKAAPLDF